MRKFTSKKLALKKETIRKLNETELRRVAGGAPPPSRGWNCGGDGGFSDDSSCCPCTGTTGTPTDPTNCPVEL